MLTIQCDRGGKEKEKCPVTPADLVLMHNYVMEALAKPDNEINEDFDLYSSVPMLKEGFLKYCRSFDSRIRRVLHDFRIETEDEEHPTTVKVKGIILEWRKRTPYAKQNTSEMSVETQFLAHDKAHYLELSSDFASISYSPKSKSALDNLRMLILLDLKILLGADIAWRKPGGVAGLAGDGDGDGGFAQAPAAASVEGCLPAAIGNGGGDDDADVSSEDEKLKEKTAPRLGAAAAPRAAPSCV